MSSIENLPDEAKRLIQDYIRRIEEAEIKKVELIQELAEQIEERGWVPPEYISSFLKKILKYFVSESSIDKALGKKHKQRHERYQSLDNHNLPVSTSEKEIEVSSIGTESYTKPDGTEGERELYEGEPEPVPSIQEVNEQATEIALTLAEQYAADVKERDLRLNEALHLADDKDKRIEQLLLENGELELKIIDLKTAADQAKEVDRKEDIQIENDNMKQTIIELQEALRAKVKTSGFTQASQLPKQVWLAAINAINFYRELNKASRFAIEHNDPWKKIIFDVAEDGQLKAAKLEGS